MKIRKFNERIESGHATWEYLVGAAEIKNIDDDDIYQSIKPEDDFIFDDRYLKKFDGGYYIVYHRGDLVLIFEGDEDTPKAILSIYEYHGSRVFENMIVIYGHETIILYNILTGSYKEIATR